MTPTMKLRFVERDIGGRHEPQKLIRILQQWWQREDREVWSIDGVIEEIIPGRGEWRDIPLGKE